MMRHSVQGEKTYMLLIYDEALQIHAGLCQLHRQSFLLVLLLGQAFDGCLCGLLLLQLQLGFIMLLDNVPEGKVSQLSTPLQTEQHLQSMQSM